MYRDEILAIGEAVREARKEGAREAADFYRGKLGATCEAARRLLRFAEDMAKVESGLTIRQIGETADIEWLKEQSVKATAQLDSIRRQAQGLNGIRVPDFHEGGPF